MPGPVGFPIGLVSLHTGLSTHVIRAWERRYKAVEPQRSPSGRRLFTQSDIDRLVLLKQVIQNGHSISQIAGLERMALVELADTTTRPRHSTHVDSKIPSGFSSSETIASCIEAIEMLDANALHRMLKQAAATFSRQALLDTIVCPLMDQVGSQWSEGSLRIVHGHLASVVIHAQLVSMLDHTTDETAEKPCLLIATPAGQCCYLGALAVAVTVKDHGWRPIFLGFNLPAEEIAVACSILDPQMIVLSITCRVNDSFMRDELIRLANLINDQCPLVIGGRASQGYRRPVEGLGGAIWATRKDLIDLLQ